ncbi:MAG TPA: SDR family oxidoreductase [Devosia sp.]|nr:SDR family oxidoreductase [Devosia sp.]
MDESSSAGLTSGAIFDLHGDVAIVTGASSGIGARFARVLAANGARVALVGRRAEALERVASDIAGAGGDAMVFAMDIADAAAIPALFDAVEARFGRATVVVNNAGIAGPGRATEIEFQYWRDIMAVDLDAAYLMCREAARRLSANGGGSIINVTSILAVIATAGDAAYSVAKAGLHHLTRVMALELAPMQVRVNAIVPGYVVTGMNRAFFESDASAPLIGTIPMQHVGQVDDLDGAILLLASKASRFMTGSTITIDGGHTTAT